jgi:hypothetical protein
LNVGPRVIRVGEVPGSIPGAPMKKSTAKAELFCGEDDPMVLDVRTSPREPGSVHAVAGGQCSPDLSGTRFPARMALVALIQ